MRTMHLFDKKYSKNSNIVKYCYKILNNTFYFNTYFQTYFFPVMAKLNFTYFWILYTNTHMHAYI